MILTPLATSTPGRASALSAKSSGKATGAVMNRSPTTVVWIQSEMAWLVLATMLPNGDSLRTAVFFAIIFGTLVYRSWRKL